MTDRPCDPKAALTRRQFLFLGGAALVPLALPKAFHGLPGAETMSLQGAGYPRRKVGRFGPLKVGQPASFRYPYDHPYCENILVRLGVAAAGGVGPAEDVVAFNSLCPHQGGPLDGRLSAEHQVLGPCPLHLSTFDLTRHGMVVSGHATQGLPQIVLELEGDDIYASGVIGLIYGFHNNLADPNAR